MKKTFKDVLIEALQSDKVTLYSVNQNLAEVAKATKKKSAFLKVCVNDKTAEKMMRRDDVGFMFLMNGDELNAIAERMEQEEVEISQ